MGDKLKIVRRNGFTVLPNDVIFDKALTLSSKGLLGVMLALPDNWEYSIGGLAALCDCGRDRIRTSLVNIEEAGYLLREQERGEGGKFVNTYVVFDAPQAHRVGLSDADEPTRKTRQYINNNNTLPPIVPQGGRRSRNEPKGTPEWKPERFAGLWEYYKPHSCRGGKQDAIRAWDRLQLEDGQIDAMCLDLKRRMATDRWQEGIGIKNVSSYLNQRCWEDGNFDRPSGAESRHSEGVQFGWQ